MSRLAGRQLIRCLVCIFTVSLFYIFDRNFLLLERALMFQFEVESFTLHNKDLRPLLISEDEWDAIKLVCGWLLNFREATKQMSTTSKPMISTTHAILCHQIYFIFIGTPELSLYDYCFLTPVTSMLYLFLRVFLCSPFCSLIRVLLSHF